MLVFIYKPRVAGHQIPVEAKVQYVSHDAPFNAAQLPQ